MSIAAFIGRKGEVADFYEEGKICLFEKISDYWVKSAEVPLSLTREMSLAEVKATLTRAVSHLEGCRIFLVSELRGILRVYLAEMGYRIWKSEGPLLDQLEQVAIRDREMLAETRDDSIPSPLPVGRAEDDLYRIDLIELLKSGSPHVSREVLLPFFETVSFRQLDIVCDHVPRWFAMELPALGLQLQSQTPNPTGEGLLLTIHPKCGARSCPPGKRSSGFSCHCGG